MSNNIRRILFSPQEKQVQSSKSKAWSFLFSPQEKQVQSSKSKAWSFLFSPLTIRVSR